MTSLVVMVALACSCFNLESNAQKSKQDSAYKSEQDLFRQLVKRRQKQLDKTKNLAFGLDFQLTNSFGVLSETYALANGIYISAIPAAKGFFPIGKSLYFDFHVPYIVTAQISSTPGGLPGITDFHFSTANGIGDVNAGFNWRRFNEKNRTEFNSSVSLLAPSGRSSFKDTTADFIPLGGGFWILALNGGFSKYMSNRLFISLDISYLERIKTRFAVMELNGPLGKTNKYATANPVLSAGVDIGILGTQEASISSRFSLTYNEIYIGKTFTQADNQASKIFKDVYKLHRLGLKWTGASSIHSIFTIFAGAQLLEDIGKNKSNISFLIDTQIPLGFDKLAIKLY